MPFPPGQNNPVGRGVGAGPVSGGRHQPGPGNYSPPLHKSPKTRPGAPVAGQQLLKISERKRQREREQEQGRDPTGRRVHGFTEYNRHKGLSSPRVLVLSDYDA